MNLLIWGLMQNKADNLVTEDYLSDDWMPENAAT
jgi:hypothetical protein